MSENEKQQNKNIDHAFSLMCIDFEQRSRQVDSMALDRSKFLRISLLVWGAPLIIAASLVDKNLIDVFVDTTLQNKHVLGWIVIATSFVFSSLINTVIFFSMVNNRNTTNLAASGINYIRSVYFLMLSEEKILKLSDSLKSKVLDIEGDMPIFRVIRSATVDYGLVVGVFVNILYALSGLIVFTSLKLPYALFCLILFLFALASNILVLVEMKFQNVFNDMKKNR